MLGNCEKMVLISSTTNEWPQNQIIDEKSLMASTTAARVMEKPTQQEQQQQQQALKCPRCDSSNTKFCYYNNYSLSQPRHFCKACKRYWTRGGTLRNVPVGGGCRKNKRVKRPAGVSSAPVPVDHAPSSSSNPSPNLDSNNHVNPLFYSALSTNPNSELNLPYNPTFNSRVSDYDLQPQMNALGLGFSSGLMASHDHNHAHNSNSLLSSYPMFGSSTSSSTTTPTMTSLLSSSLQQQRYMGGSVLYEDGSIMKDVKMEGNQNRFDWNSFPSQNQIEQIGSSDPNSLVWNTTGMSAWLDPTNIGSSVPSLI